MSAFGLALSGCGATGQNSPLGASGPSQPEALPSGRIAPELMGSPLSVKSALGPAQVRDDRFEVAISQRGVGLIALEDASGRVRGLSLTFPNTPPNFSPEATALASLFLVPGLGRSQPAAAAARIAQLQTLSTFAAFQELLRQRAATPLDLLSGDPAFIQAREAVLAELGNPFPQQDRIRDDDPGSQVSLFNPSLRFVSLIRQDSRGSLVLPQLLAPFESLDDVVQEGENVVYWAKGPGLKTTDPADPRFLDTSGPTLFFLLYQPLLELMLGQPLTAGQGLELYQELDLSFPPLDLPDGSPAVQQQALVERLQAVDQAATFEDVTQSVEQNFANLAKIITAGAYLAGFAGLALALTKFKAHKDNPTQVPIGTPIHLLFVAAALLLLPSVIQVQPNKTP